MPFTPFLGLSVLVHMLVILGHKIFSRSVTVGSLVMWKTTRLLRMGVTLLVASVFILVLSTASMLVRSSVLDKNSSISLTEHYMSLASKTYFQSGDNLSINTKALPVSMALASDKVQENKNICTEYKVPISNYNNSLVDYLISKNQGHSFAARSRIAVSRGIKDYSGSSPQNLLLLRQMISSELCQT